MWVYREPKIIAELGCNHQGKLEKALRMVDVISACGGSGVKLQKRFPKAMPKEKYNAPHPNPEHAFGKMYGEHREALELTLDEHHEIKQRCEKYKILYGLSIFDKESADQVIGSDLRPDYIKIGSGQNLDFPLMQYLRDHYQGPIHLSLGMTTRDEVDKIRAFWQRHDSRIVYYHCVSGYPIDVKDACLKEITNIRYQEALGIGFSGHHLGIGIDAAAYAMGAEWIERHFTLDKTAKGTDQAMSIDAGELTQLVKNLSECYRALTYKPAGLIEVEKPIRERYKCCREAS